jgi:hypothetical protein
MSHDDDDDIYVLLRAKCRSYDRIEGASAPAGVPRRDTNWGHPISNPTRQLLD